MEKKETNKQRIGLFLLIYGITVIVTAGVGYLYGLIMNQIIANTVMAGIGSGVLLFSIQQELQEKAWDYDNGMHFSRFVLVYFINLVAAFLLPLLPIGGWFYPLIAVSLAIYSNTTVGMVSSSVLLMISVLTGGASVGVYILYFISNVVAIFAFRKLDDSFKVGIPTFLTMLILFVSTMAMDILFIPSKLSVEVFIIPISNVFITSLLLMIVMKNFSVLVVHKYRNKYMAINDQEYDLLVKLKQESRETYYHAIHCAYLCERIATQLQLNVTLAKAAGYYHKIGVLKGKNGSTSVAEICKENDFPPDIVDLLMQYLDKNVKLTSKEGTILLFVDAVISSLMYLFEKDKNAQFDYEQIVGTIFKKKMESGSVKDSNLTISELNKIQKIFVEEKLYYDFLR